MPTHVNELTGVIIGAAIEVHRALGPGLLESAYHKCLTRELEIHGVAFKYKWPFSLEYKGVFLNKAYEIDLIVEEAVVVEVKSLLSIAPVHEAQLLTYMRLQRIRIGLLLNFNEVVLKDGIRRKIMDFE
jgi:GxxExxY protein